jgi:hypothetical protein
MMVDTINPNTNEPDSFINGQKNTNAGMSQQPQPADPGHFYGGFDRPDDVKINLATDGTGGSTEPPVSSMPEQPQSQPEIVPEPTPAAPPTSPVGPTMTDTVTSQKPAIEPEETQIHASYASKTPLNIRGLLVIGGLFIVISLTGGAIAYFATNAIDGSNQKKLEDQLSSLQNRLSALQQQPTALTPPSSEESTGNESTTGTTNTETTTPATTTTNTETTTPSSTPAIETPSTTVSPATNNSRLGTG